MTLREVQALLVLYAAATNEARHKAVKLVPELGELVRTANARTYTLEAVADGQVVGQKNVTCSAEELSEHRRRFAIEFSSYVAITAKERG